MATTKKITELDEVTSVADTDVLYLVKDPSNIPLSKKVTVGNLLKNVVEVSAAPASPTATGTQGQIIYNAGYIYICVEANVWVRAAALPVW